MMSIFFNNLGKVGNVTCTIIWYFRVACKLKMYTWYRLRKRIFSSPCCSVVPHEAWLAQLKRIVPFTVLGAKIQSSFIAEHCRALLSITEHGWALLSIAEHCWALLSIAENCWALLSIAEHYWALLSIFSNTQAFLSCSCSRGIEFLVKRGKTPLRTSL